MNKPKRPGPRPRFHYLECPKCEACFRVDKSVTSVPAHKCWAEEKEKAKALIALRGEAT